MADVTLIGAPSKKHARGISAALHRGITADGAIYLHPAESGRGLNEIKAFTAGQLEFRITIFGRPPDTSEPAHTVFAHRAVNPFEKAMEIVTALKALDKSRAARVNHPLLEAVIGRSTNLVLTSCSFGNEAATARISGNCRLGGVLSLVPNESLEAVMREVEEVVGAAARADDWLSSNPPSLEWLSGVSGAETSADSLLFRTVHDCLARNGAKPSVNPLHTSSDIRNPIVQKGIPTVGYGPLCGGLVQNGLADEWVDVADYLRAIRVTAEIMVEWCGAK
jgi:acetylornithine deacetylase